MRILADENVPGPVVRALREAGRDVLWAKQTMPGARDREVLARAQAELRLVVTYDKDFGELAVRLGLSAENGVVLVRLGGPSPEIDNARVVSSHSLHFRLRHSLGPQVAPTADTFTSIRAAGPYTPRIPRTVTRSGCGIAT